MVNVPLIMNSLFLEMKFKGGSSQKFKELREHRTPLNDLAYFHY